jgi:hypothetical protein
VLEGRLIEMKMRKILFLFLSMIIVFLISGCSFFTITSRTFEVEKDKTPIYNDLYFMNLNGNVRTVCERESFYETVLTGLVEENGERIYEPQTRNGDNRCYIFDSNGYKTHCWISIAHGFHWELEYYLNEFDKYGRLERRIILWNKKSFYTNKPEEDLSAFLGEFTPKSILHFNYDEAGELVEVKVKDFYLKNRETGDYEARAKKSKWQFPLLNKYPDLETVETDDHGNWTKKESHFTNENDEYFGHTVTREIEYYSE